MPRYFFNVVDGISTQDTDGVELADLHTARTEAIKLSGALLREMDAESWDGTEWRLQVADETGQTLLTLRFSVEQAAG